MFNIAAEEKYSDGQIIFEEGNHGDWFYVILSGGVEISKKVGDKKVVIKRLQSEEVFGELGFLGHGDRIATARAIGETNIGIIDRKTMEQEFNKLSTEFRSVLMTVVNRLKETVVLACRLSARK